MCSPFFTSRALTVAVAPSMHTDGNNDFMSPERLKMLDNVVFLEVSVLSGFIICFWLVTWVNLQNVILASGILVKVGKC